MAGKPPKNGFYSPYLAQKELKWAIVVPDGGALKIRTDLCPWRGNSVSVEAGSGSSKAPMLGQVASTNCAESKPSVDSAYRDSVAKSQLWST